MKHEEKLFVSTLVHYNNWFGKLYMGLILPFHKRVLLAILKSAVKNGKICVETLGLDGSSPYPRSIGGTEH